MMAGVSILLTVHNGADSLGDTLAHVAAQRKPGDAPLEVIVVDDRSTDGTSAVARAAAISDLRVVRLDAAAPPGATQRQLALDAAIVAARGDRLLLLDADAHAPGDWAVRMVDALDTFDAVAWPIAFRPADESATARRLAAMQTADHAFYTTMCAWVNAMGLASGLCFGAAGFRRAVVQRVGGFGALGFTLTEDLHFARAAHAAGATIRFPRGDAVTVRGARSWRELRERALRVSATGGPSALAAAIVLWAITLPLVAFLVLGGVLAPVWIIARYAAGVALVLAGLRRGRALVHWPAAMVYEVAAMAAAIAVGIRSLAVREVTWGGVRYPRAPRTGRSDPSSKPSSVLPAAPNGGSGGRLRDEQDERPQGASAVPAAVSSRD